MGRTPLFAAVLDGSTEEVRRLLAADADPNAIDDRTGWSCLRAATCSGYRPDLIRLLVQAGADPNDWRQSSPLLGAAGAGDLALFDWLIEQGAQLCEDDLEVIAGHGSPAMIDAALASRPLRRSDDEDTAQGPFRDAPTGETWAQEIGSDALEALWALTLQNAAGAGARDAVDTILARRGSLQLVRLAWSEASSGGHLALVEHLESQFSPSQMDLDGALHRCASPGVADHLLRVGANIEARDIDLRTALLRAVETAPLPYVRWLCDRGADVHAVDARGLGAVAHAERHVHAVEKRPAVRDYLIERGCKNERWPEAQSREPTQASLGDYLMLGAVILVPIGIYWLASHLLGC